MTKRILALVLALVMCMTLVACGGESEPETEPHTHSWGDYVADGETGHHQKCTGCDSTNATVAHVFDSDTDDTCDTCGYTREVAPQETEPVSYENENTLYVLYARSDTPEYDQDLYLYNDGTYFVNCPNSPGETWSGVWSMDGETFEIEMFGEYRDAVVELDEDGNLLSVSVDVFGGTTVYKVAPKTVAVLYARSDTPEYDQDLYLYSDGTYWVTCPNSPGEEWSGVWSMDGETFEIEMFGEYRDTVLELDANGDILSVTVDVFGGTTVYKAAPKTILVLYARGDTPEYDQDLYLYSDGTYFVSCPNSPGETWSGVYSFNGTEFEIEMFGDYRDNEMVLDDNGNIVQVSVDVFGGTTVYKAVVAALYYREGDAAYHQDMVLYADGTYTATFPNTPSDNTAGTYTLAENVLEYEMFGNTITAEVSYDKDGNVVSFTAEIYGDTVTFVNTAE